MGVWVSDYKNEDLDFKLNFWNWRPIASLICESGLLCPEDKEIFESGHGGLNAEEARDLALHLRETIFDAMEKSYHLKLDGLLACRTVNENNTVFLDDISKNYGCSYESLERFINFLENCNGFCIR